jgi:hypothetical protein
LSFNIPYNIATQNLDIYPYSATVNCGSLPNTWIYSGIDMADGLPVDVSSNFITINPNSGAITVG